MKTVDFQKVLIANRGEIACRIIRTLKKLGIRSVAVYSDADRNALHVQQADEAIHIGAAPASESYLNIGRIIQAAQMSGADAIHPGYGFLSENAIFAEECVKHGIRFIGPDANAIRVMGSKSAAKRLMETVGVPLIPGYHGDDQADSRLTQEAEKIGFPVLLKAAMGGGGKGMRIVHSIAELPDAISSCRREALASFSDDTLLIEKYIGKPRHVEVQIFCDEHGNAVHLFERDCSIQRRHQKIIEECPAPDLPADIRNRMTRDAILAARAINYTGAGTVEFLYDGAEHYYFMEMNTRLQVEHPVTEMVTGEDLVAWQIRVAETKPLPKTQEQIRLHGHAIEVRICAENPALEFAPSIGILKTIRKPALDTHIRLDHGIRDEDQVTIFYDPMIAKLIVWDGSREDAIRRMKQALEEYCIAGIHTNIGYLHCLVSTQDFYSRKLATDFISINQNLLSRAAFESDEPYLVAAIFEYLAEKIEPTTDEWKFNQGWGLNASAKTRYRYAGDSKSITITIEEKENRLIAVYGKQTAEVHAQLMDTRLLVSGSINGCYCVKKVKTGISVFKAGFRIDIVKFDSLFENMGADSHHKLTSPMPGVISRIMVARGDSIHKGQPLLVLEAMKMEHTIRADKDGIVGEVFCSIGETVQANRILVDVCAAISARV